MKANNWDKAMESDADRREELARYREYNDIRLASKPSYEKVRWPDEVEELLHIWGETASPRLFYLQKEGDILENERIVQAVAYIKNGKSLPQDLVGRILAKPSPVLRLKAVKVERKEYDLFQTALDYGQKSLVEQLLPYINSIDDYDQKKIEELLKK